MDVKELQEKLGAITGETPLEDNPLVTFSISVEGREGSGKTYFGLMTCPTPIVHVNFGDRDATLFRYGMSEERRKLTTLYALHPENPEGWTVDEGKRSLNALAEILRTHLKDGQLAGGTFILDSGSSWWSVMQDVYVAPEEEASLKLAVARGKEFKKSGGLIYGKANGIVRGVIGWAKNQGSFVVITHQKKQAWDADGPVKGKYNSKINTEVPYLVEVQMDVTKVCSTCGGPDCEAAGHVGRTHRGKFTKFGGNTALEGMTIDNPTFDQVYPLYASKPYPSPERLK